MKVCLVYDRVNKIGGAERVLQALHEIFPDAPLYTAVYNPHTAPWAQHIRIVPSFLNRLPLAKTHHELLPLVTPYAFESFDLTAYDVIISITSTDAKAVITSPKQLHICYLLTPTRYLWSHYQDYFKQGLKGLVLRLCLSKMRRFDLVAAGRPDSYISISHYVAKRLKYYYQRRTDAVIYPPVDVGRFADHPTVCMQPPEPYFLVVSRLVPYKKVDLAITACNQLKQNLIIVGSGSDYHRVKKMAGPTVTFVGQVSDQHLSCLYHHAEALIFPQEEEFGITAVEAQAAGLPVIAYQGGAASEIVKPGITGILFPEQSAASLAAVLATWKHHTWYDKNIKEHAGRFGKEMFQKAFKSYVEDSWQKLQRRD